jgi:PAS domain-containing protein
MNQKLKKTMPLLVVGAAVLGLMFWLSRTGERVSETPVRVDVVTPAGQGAWSVPPEAVGSSSGASYVVRPVSEAGGRVVLAAEKLRPGDLVVATPAKVAEGEALSPVAGVSEERLVALVLEAGMDAVARKDLPGCVRFISPGYRDAWGYNIALLRQLLKRSFTEFDQLQCALAAPPAVHVQGREAVAVADVRLSATFRGRRNYLLGDASAANQLHLTLTRAAYGWKLSRIEGLRPLGFEERFVRLLGREIGMPLSESERAEQQPYCMRCRERMRERFGPPDRPLTGESKRP